MAAMSREALAVDGGSAAKLLSGAIWAMVSGWRRGSPGYAWTLTMSLPLMDWTSGLIAMLILSHRAGEKRQADAKSDKGLSFVNYSNST